MKAKYVVVSIILDVLLVVMLRSMCIMYLYSGMLPTAYTNEGIISALFWDFADPIY